MNWIRSGLAGLAMTVAFSPYAAEPLLPAMATLVEQGARVAGSFDAPAGLTGYAVEYQGQVLTLYLLPDGEHVLLGQLLDADGNDLGAAPLEELVYMPLSAEMWSAMASTSWIADGNNDAERKIYVFVDPNCPYCTAFWNSARPWVEAGKVQLRHIPVGILREDSVGKAAALLAADDPEQALQEHERAGRASTLSPLSEIPADIARQLSGNREVMHRLGAQATPTIFWRNETGRLQYHQGAPQDDQLELILGPR